MRLSDKTYDILKWIQKIFVLLAALYKGIAGVWNLPYGSEISETFLLLATFLLGILEIASAKYNKDLNADSKEERDDELNPDIVSHEDKDGVG